MIRQLQTLGLLLALALTYGCATAPDTPAKTLAVGYITVETLAEATAVAYQDGSITAEQKASVKGKLQIALDNLELGNQLMVANEDPTAYVNMATALLAEIARTLRENANE